MGSLVLAIAALQVKALSVSGIKAAPTNPPEAAGQFPFSVAYPRKGELALKSAGWAEALHTVAVEFHCSRAHLPLGVSEAMPMIEAYEALLIGDPTLGGTVSTLQGVTYEFGRLEWGGIETIGVRFAVEIKVGLVST